MEREDTNSRRSSEPDQTPGSTEQNRTSDPPTRLFRNEGLFNFLPVGITLPPPTPRTSFGDQANPTSPEAQFRHSSTSSVDSGYATGPHMHPLDRQDPSRPPTHPPPTTTSSTPTNINANFQLPIQQPSASFQLPIQQPPPLQQQPLPSPNNNNRPACVPCRRKKVGCDLRQAGNDYDPPCLRCRNENQRCYFAGAENIPNNPSPQELPSICDLACQHCSLVFLRDQDLRAHLRTQCQEKHYVCNTCQARFRRLNDLDRHARIHTGERPHTCDVCNRKFSRATTLSRHRQGPNGCAGRRAELGRRRVASYASADSQPTTPSDYRSSASSLPAWSPSPSSRPSSSNYPPIDFQSPPPPPMPMNRYSDGMTPYTPGMRQYPTEGARRYSSTDATSRGPTPMSQRPGGLQRLPSDVSMTTPGTTPAPQEEPIIKHDGTFFLNN